MILGFSTQINRKPTYFVEKIWKGFKECISKELQHSLEKTMSSEELTTPYEVDGKVYLKVLPKIHTIREDKTNRWKAGVMIDYFINVRTKDMFRFAPRIPVVSIQKITMSYAWNDIINIWINGRELTPSERLELAVNDGFDNWKDFFDYFYPVIKSTEDNFWKGKIIHWTDKRY